MGAFLPGLPVYGGLARSKVNEYSGSRTLLSGVSLAVFTFLAAQYLLKPLAWLPVRTPTWGAVDDIESIVVGGDFDCIVGLVERSAKGLSVLLVDGCLDRVGDDLYRHWIYGVLGMSPLIDVG